jgi:hypothetical protein
VDEHVPFPEQVVAELQKRHVGQSKWFAAQVWQLAPAKRAGHRQSPVAVLHVAPATPLHETEARQNLQVGPK